MSEQIRPLATYKKANPEIYKGKKDATAFVFEGEFSPKQEENNFYWWYGISESEIPTEINGKPNSFYWSNKSTMHNKCTVTEMGRLLMYGWYYNNVKFTLRICENIYNAYIYKMDNNITFNDLEFSTALQHIRDNFIYYYQNEEDLKIYMLKHFFGKEIKAVLPEPPEEIKEFDEIMSWIVAERKGNLKKDKDYYYRKCSDYEDYTEYLEEILKLNCIEHSSFDEQCIENQKWRKEYAEGINSIDAKYQKDCRSILLKNNLLNASEEQGQLT